MNLSILIIKMIDETYQCELIISDTPISLGNFDQLYDITDINKPYKDGNTLLHDACMINNLKAVEYLITQDNVEIDARNDDGKTPFYIACEMKYKKIILLLLKTNKINLTMEPNNEVININYIENNLQIIKLLVNYGIKSNHNTAKKFIRKENHDLAYHLIKSYPEINTDVELFHLACISGNIKVVKLFIKNGIDVNLNGVEIIKNITCGFHMMYSANTFLNMKICTHLIEAGLNLGSESIIENLLDTKKFMMYHGGYIKIFLAAGCKYSKEQNFKIIKLLKLNNYIEYYLPHWRKIFSIDFQRKFTNRNNSLVNICLSIIESNNELIKDSREILRALGLVLIV